MKREEKEAVVAELREDLLSSRAVIVATSVGIPVNTINDLRSELRRGGSSFRVVKNTLARRAISGTPLQILEEHLKGPSALVFNSEDPVAPAKALAEFKKKNDAMQIRGGYLGGSLLDAAGVDRLAKMPGRDELRSKLLSAMNGVGTKFVRVLIAAPQGLLNVLNARRDSLEG
jgi:large subunit ribosomal protein L10